MPVFFCLKIGRAGDSAIAPNRCSPRRQAVRFNLFVNKKDLHFHPSRTNRAKVISLSMML